MAGRRAARRAALSMLYRWDVADEPLGPQTGEEVDPFSIETAEAVAARAEELDRRITEAAIGWTVDRMGAVERNILRMGVYELETGSVPAEVAISEAVKLARRYASNEAGKFVNGILDRIAKERAA
jgi:transcription antitermination protein NusB